MRSLKAITRGENGEGEEKKDEQEKDLALAVLVVLADELLLFCGLPTYHKI